METIKSQFATPAKAGKFLSIPMLALILVYLIFGRGSSDDGETKGAEAQQAARPGAAQPSRDNLSLPGRSRWAGTRPPGPKFGIEELLQSNPFSLPLELRPAEPPEETTQARHIDLGQRRSEGSAADETDKRATEEAVAFRARVEAVAGKSASVFAATSRGKVAFVDSRAVGVGDYLEDGVRVVDIGPGGIVVEVEPQD